MEKRQLYGTLSNKNRHDKVRWGSSLEPASPIMLDCGPGLCQTHQTPHEPGESFLILLYPYMEAPGPLCTNEASPQSMVVR